MMYFPEVVMDAFEEGTDTRIPVPAPPSLR